MEERTRAKDAASAITLILSCDDPFTLLGISRGSKVDAKEVTQTFRKLSILIHPDRCNIHGAEEAFKKIGAAKVGHCVQGCLIFT